MHSKARGTTRELLLSPTLEPAEGPWLQLQQTRCRRVLGARGCPNRNLLKTDKCFMSDRGIRTCDRRLKRAPYRARIGTHECAGMALISAASLTCGRTSLLLMAGAHPCLFHKQRRNCTRFVEKFVDKKSALFRLSFAFALLTLAAAFDAFVAISLQRSALSFFARAVPGFGWDVDLNHRPLGYEPMVTK